MIKIIYIFVFIFSTQIAFGQLRTIEIKYSNSLRQFFKDSAKLLSVAGKVHLVDGTTTIFCDSAVVNQQKKFAEVFGNVHIIDSDTMHIYGNYGWYDGNSKNTRMSGRVVLKNPSGKLETDAIDYNVGNGIGKFTTGGRILGKDGSVLTSTAGEYNTQTRNVIFKNNVHLVDKKNDIKTDSLIFNTETQLATFIAKTTINQNGTIIITNSGNYNVQTGDAYLPDKPKIIDKERDLSGDVIRKESKSNLIFIEGAARVYDKKRKVELTSNNMKANDKDETLLMTGNAKIVDKEKQVTIAGPSLFLNNKTETIVMDGEGEIIDLKNEVYAYGPNVIIDNKKEAINFYDNGLIIDRKNKIRITGKEIEFNKKRNDLIINRNGRIIDSTNKIIVIGNEIYAQRNNNSLFATKKPILISYEKNDSTFITADTIYTAQRKREKHEYDTLLNKIPKKGDSLTANDSVRYFLAYRNVKFFNDSIQGICDSLHYTGIDSSFRLYGNPFVWNENNQINGDTIYLFTKNKEPNYALVWDNSFTVSKISDEWYNQIQGKKMWAYFKEQKIDWLKVRGSPVESIFYPQDSDSAYIGMNKCSGDQLEAYFEKGELQKVKYIKDVDGAMYPIKDIPADEQKLKNFIWNEDKRPKTKFQIFE